MYWEQSATIRTNGNYSPYIDIKRGVRQGCVLSPGLFNIYTENIFKQNEENPGLNINGRTINNLRYADDTVLLAESEHELQELMTQVNHTSQEYGLEINTEKTQTMIISKTNDHPLLNIQVNGEMLKQVKSYLYLGHLITEDGRCETEIKKRIGLAKNTFYNMKHLLTSRQTNNKLKMRVIKCYIYPTLLYGAETWTMNKDLEDRIAALEMWLYRKMGRISWKQKLTNNAVMEKLGVKRELLTEIKIRQMKYFGHIKRHNSLLKTVLEGKVEGSRARGGQRYKWEGNIKRWTDTNLSNLTIKTRDREGWRSFTANLH